MTVRRRDILSLLPGAALGWSFEARAQQARKLPVVGFLFPGFSAVSGPGQVYSEFIAGLRKVGFEDGESVRIEARFAEGQPQRLAGMANDLVRLNVDVLLAVARPSIDAAKAATKDIPIVALDLENDPVASNYVASLAAPGGNITGLFLDAPGLTGKWLQQVREIAPTARKIAVLWDPNTGDSQLRALQAAATTLSVDLQILEIRDAGGLESTLAAGLKEQPQALIQLGSPLIRQSGEKIVRLLGGQPIPAISMFRSFPDSGGLMSYGPDLGFWYRRLGEYVALILKGAKAATTPVDRPTKFEMVLNLKAAAAMGLTIPTTVLAQADEVIE